MRETDTHIYFYSGRTVFSNWHHSIKQIHDELSSHYFNSSEEGFMFYKAHFFGDREMAEAIAESGSPAEAKALGRKVANYNDKKWECVRLGYMTYINLLKYQQNKEFAKILLATGTKILVEASPYDKIWGVGLSEDDDRILDKKNWLGRNLLGHSLMKVRELIK